MPCTKKILNDPAMGSRQGRVEHLYSDVGCPTCYFFLMPIVCVTACCAWVCLCLLFFWHRSLWPIATWVGICHDHSFRLASKIGSTCLMKTAVIPKWLKVTNPTCAGRWMSSTRSPQECPNALATCMEIRNLEVNQGQICFNKVWSGEALVKVMVSFSHIGQSIKRWGIYFACHFFFGARMSKSKKTVVNRPLCCVNRPLYFLIFLEGILSRVEFWGVPDFSLVSNWGAQSDGIWWLFMMFWFKIEGKCWEGLLGEQHELDIASAVFCAKVASIHAPSWAESFFFGIWQYAEVSVNVPHPCTKEAQNRFGCAFDKRCTRFRLRGVAHHEANTWPSARWIGIWIQLCLLFGKPTWCQFFATSCDCRRTSRKSTRPHEYIDSQVRSHKAAINWWNRQSPAFWWTLLLAVSTLWCRSWARMDQNYNDYPK